MEISDSKNFQDAPTHIQAKDLQSFRILQADH